MATTYDAIIIGTGDAGPSLAVRLAGTAMKVAMAVDTCSSPPLSAINPPEFAASRSPRGRSECLPRAVSGGKAVLEGVHVAWRSALAFQSCHFVSS
jgi:hypothetical protein